MRPAHPSLKLSTKIFLGLTGLAFAVASAGNVMLYLRASGALRDEVREHLKAIASTAAAQIDPAAHSSIRTRADEGSATYRMLKSQLATAKRANPTVRFIYTMRPSFDPSKWTFVVDAESNPRLLSHVGDRYNANICPEIKQAVYMPSADKEPSHDHWGWWLSGYAPIRDARGRTEAIVGVDMSLDQLRAEEADLRRSALSNSLISLLISVSLSWILTSYAARLVDRFVTAAQRVSAGDLDFQLPTTGSEEIREVATAVNGMIAGLQRSSRDFVTGLDNHMHMHERLQEEIERADRYGHRLCVMMIDLDRFKGINDTLGHPVGDSILWQLATVIRASLRGTDIAARYGGDEFIVLLPETDLECGLAVAERLRADVESYVFDAVPTGSLAPDCSRADRGIHVTVTLGVACYPEHHDSKDGLVMAADIALCRAKRLSRNSVGAYDRSIGGEDVDPYKQYQMLHDPSGAAVASLAAAVDARDRYTSGHSKRVARLAKAIAEEVHTGEDVADAIAIAGLLHDVGKIGIPDTILNNADGLTLDGRTQIQKHPSLGADILRCAPHLERIIPAVMHHHERWDGAGYPDGLAGEAIPLAARIMAIADAFDAMTSHRPYREAMTPETAMAEVQAGAGTQFDPDLVEAFATYMHTSASWAA